MPQIAQLGQQSDRTGRALARGFLDEIADNRRERNVVIVKTSAVIVRQETGKRKPPCREETLRSDDRIHLVEIDVGHRQTIVETMLYGRSANVLDSAFVETTLHGETRSSN